MIRTVGEAIEELQKYDKDASFHVKVNGNDEFCYLLINEVYGDNETGVVMEVE